MTPFYYDFKPGTIENIPEVYVRVGDGHRISVTKAGTIELCFSNHVNMQEQTTITITDVLYVPEITHRLASTDVLNENGYSVLFSARGPSIQIMSKQFHKTLLLPRTYDYIYGKYQWPRSCRRLIHQRNMFPISPDHP